MKKVACRRFLVCAMLGSALALGWCVGVQAEDHSPSGLQSAQRGGTRGNRAWGRWWRGSNEHQKNHANIKSIYSQAAKSAGDSTVQILTDGKAVALGTVVDSDGYVVTKASLLEAGKRITCRKAEGAEEEIAATLIGINENYDLGLLKLEGEPWSVPAARESVASPGTFVAALGVQGEVLGVGVVSIEPRSVKGSRQGNPRRGWLGVTLGGGDAGTSITAIVEKSAAERAGLRPGDRIKSIDAREITSMQQIIDTIGGHAAGDTVELLVQRGGEQLSLSATLGKPAMGSNPHDQWGGGPFSDRRDGFPEVLMHDTVVSPDQCGGPLVDTEGKVVGVNIARALRVTTYAVPWDKVILLVNELKATHPAAQ